jgi:Methyltransferase domain
MLMTALVFAYVCRNDVNLTRETYNQTKLIQVPEDFTLMQIDEMSDDQLFCYLRWTNSSTCQLAYDFGGKVRVNKVGKGIDGQKTVCMDPGVAPVAKNCIIYSFGINNEWSFDKMFESFGCQVYAFDPSMDMKDGDYTDNIHFQQTGLSGTDTDHDNRGWKMRTLDSIYQTLNHSAPIDYLKVDIEGDEWNWLQQLLKTQMLEKVKQLGLELHFKPNMEDIRKGSKILKNLEMYGMIRFSSRVNIWMKKSIAALNRQEPLGYEITWYNSKFKV